MTFRDSFHPCFKNAELLFDASKCMRCQCDSILLFFCPAKCVCFISSYKDSSNVVFYLKADADSTKIICVLFMP